ncbi:helix-turn-helix transcriptional regulator [Actinosynnema sp. CS-041913]|uniref:helix-turn-helix transcriptional regulator n=1 Tax=Actinosynnema sp. CS-041913 TaxID=3239917 RepID=UPI003D90DD7B
MIDKAEEGARTAPAAVRLAQEIKRLRDAAGLSQPHLAVQIGYTRQYVSFAERVGSNLPSRELVNALDRVLGASGALISLRDQAQREQRAVRRRNNAPQQDLVETSWQPSDGAVGSPEVVHAAIPRLRRALDAIDVPDDGPTRPSDEIASDVATVSRHRLEARYALLVRRLPELIFELARARQLRGNVEDVKIAALLAMVFRAADGVAFKFGYHDLSARLIDLMRQAATTSEDPLLTATATYVRTECFFASGDLETASHALVAAADNVKITDANTGPAAAAYGALHMRAAVVAARAGNADSAADHLREADRAARLLPEGVYHGTAFGPSSLRIHELAVATELHDTNGIRRAADWHPPAELPAERRSHYYIDLGRAQLRLGHHDDAYTCLELAREAAPQHTREHPQVRKALSTLLRTHRSPDTGLIDLAAWANAR